MAPSPGEDFPTPTVGVPVHTPDEECEMGGLENGRDELALLPCC
jgi:hypothetical protein